MITRDSVLILATRSAGKLAELRPLVVAHGWEIETLADLGVDEVVEEALLEDAETFEENALAKARYFAARTGRAVLADDSGLAVDLLQGRPGVHSKRWSHRPDLEGAALDAENNALLLSTLRAIGGDPSARRARYVCAAAFVAGERSCVVRGETTGRILEAPRGIGGFGYDPLFVSDDLGVTFGEASREAKAAVSHRGRAFRALLDAVARGEFRMPR
jgi:XTP/dITP diphosphohydrolase